jgi:hypothetical protein
LPEVDVVKVVLVSEEHGHKYDKIGLLLCQEEPSAPVATDPVGVDIFHNLHTCLAKGRVPCKNLQEHDHVSEMDAALRTISFHIPEDVPVPLIDDPDVAEEEVDQQCVQCDEHYALEEVNREGYRSIRSHLRVGRRAWVGRSGRAGKQAGRRVPAVPAVRVRLGALVVPCG